MRIALLSALADLHGSGDASAGERPALRRFAGKSVLAHQIDCAAHLGCVRVVCLAPGSGPDLGPAKAYAQRAGMRFDRLANLTAVATEITADDEIIHIADGVLPDCGRLIEVLADQPGVLAFPDDPALDLGFERLDATRAWSGALRTRGDSVARLADMPPDCDLGSSLLRIALQAGGRVVDLDPAPLVEQTWQRRVDRHASSEIEWRWITRQVRPASFVAPGAALTERFGLRWAHDLVGGRWRNAPHLVALIAGIAALAAVPLAWPIVGLAALLVTSAAMGVARMFDRVEALGATRARSGWIMKAAGWIRDGLVVALLTALVMTVPGWLGVFLPLVMMAIVWLGEKGARPEWRALFGDRVLLLAVLLPAAYLGWSTIAVAALILAGLMVLLWSLRAAVPQITAD